MVRVEQRLNKIINYKSESRIFCGSESRIFFGSKSRIVCGSNFNDIIMDQPHVGTCMRSFDRVSTYSSSHDVNPSGLGLRSYIVLEVKCCHKAFVLDAYILCNSQVG